MTKKDVSPTQRMLNAWAIVVIIWSVYRAFVKTDLPLWFDELIAKPLVFILPVAYYISRYETRGFFKGLDLKRSLPDFILGLSLGIAVLGMSLFTFGTSKAINLPSMSVIGGLFFIALATSMSEEILSRGFVLKRLYEESKNIIGAIFFASFLFFVLHIPILFTNKDIFGITLIQVMATDLLMSFGISLIYLQRKNLIIPILIHTFYTFALYLVM
ncbi:hypothetical protein A3A93_00520 [Candidatus Roizmanbacteria bacterium RIFCSPLOWO2_01_FULL_38_12]|uniref:CAAX prenyl protease 2/Lysostaphin resistance protein A-like domain-containing protein n=1 Tax=Candidatus Roizmanbacteria bacterium RIFCSPLOWO2_01_FULL_38_12 TaxID=1802061 RepID=A0A1F7IXQ3_9BACT|nr:MAG: hypothetical protein A2861_00200 [Candidatus Roizmanbacteria bacterium RIFCSPHIGHO2_01_FULL_38_15]OGK36116.1 MAG: hypothetical protein A3F59_01445 [Candidatus Roizmanbacteria bacterium RIFCSPHIGHO2_12_FULL_38_13]OGK48162.1 MAG: hypothetical protein A3A93_00520 [Candidatus Roizmanbacteria bacterium RIFCSPLOWO2_01_FULL_38_12]